MPYLNRAVKRRRRWTMMWTHRAGWTYRNIDQAQLSELAAKLALVGHSNDPLAQSVYSVVVALCLASKRLKYRSFKQNVTLLPTNKDKLVRLAQLGEATEEAFGALETVNFSSVQNFVDAALLCPNRSAGSAHINRCLSDSTFDKKQPWAILTPGAVRNTSGTHRGAFCEYVDGGEYRDQIRRRLRTVT